MYQCTRPECGFRFPAEADHPTASRCPQCGAPTLGSSTFLAAAQPFAASPQVSVHLEALLDNLRSAWNVGSIFRIADGAGVKRLHLCGTTPPGDHPRIPKTALGAEHTIGWRYHLNGLYAARALLEEGYRLWALETTVGAESLFDLLPVNTPERLALVLGNERTGIDPDILALCDRHLYLPMLGIKESLNVAVAFGIAAYALLHTR
ncbi:MAG: hypothetical protein Fur0018_21400 [Anaerolineales bacterium]